MRARAGVLGFAGVVLLLPCLACDDLALPANPDAGPGPASTGPTTSEDGGKIVLPSYVPAGAIPGDSVVALNSRLYSWAVLQDNKVASVGFNLPLTAVSTLQGAPSDMRVWLKMPAEVLRDTSLTGIAYDYLPAGHVPKGVYDVPHWEWRLIMQDLAEVQSLDCTDPTLPVPSVIPELWVVLPPPDNCYTQMGIHSFSVLAPEFNGQRFKIGNLLVFYRGNGKLKDLGARVTSYEPKATTQALLERKSIEFPMPQKLPPGFVGRPGAAPTVMKADYDTATDSYIFTVSGFVPTT